MAAKSKKRMDINREPTLVGPLSDFASVEQGAHFREMVKEGTGGDMRIILIKNIIPDFPIQYEALTKVQLKKVKESQKVKNGDVLFISRGERKEAVALSNPPENVIVGAQIFIIRIFDERLLPKYLAWYINQQIAQEYIEKHSKGSNILIINKQDISNLPITVPPIKVQKMILHVYTLKLRETNLVQDIEKCRKAMVEMTLLAQVTMCELGSKIDQEEGD